MRKTLFLLLLSFASGAGAQMYKCVDERGVTHYTDRPLPGCKGGEVDIRAIPPTSGQVTPPGEDLRARDAELRQRQAERGRMDAQERAAFDENCRRSRNEFSRLTSQRRIGSVDEKGERVYMDDSVRDQRIAELKEAMRKCP